MPFVEIVAPFVGRRVKKITNENNEITETEPDSYPLLTNWNDFGYDGWME